MASVIGQYLKGLLEEYKNFRGTDLTTSTTTKPFWDAVVITTSDVNQQTAFQHQIDDKRSRRELPIGLAVHIVPDSPGVRIGNGGSTLTVIEFLESHYGLDLYKKKIFLIHAGGWSQRMPSASILGKIFSIIPYGSPPFQMLDIKLALYWPFVDKIQPGIFLVCADDFTIHNLGSDLDLWSAPGRGFSALAHPSPMMLGRAHGVYVPENPQDIDYTQHVVVRKCVEVLQKPNDSRMISQCAVLPLRKDAQKPHTFADGIRLDGDVVYTDSCFYFGTDIVEKLLKLKKSIGELTCEIDAYGDLLQCVGENATIDYVNDTKNVSLITSSLLDTRRLVFHTLNGSDINLLLLNASAYVHIGTTKELLYYMCRDEDFHKKLSLEKDVFNFWHETTGCEEHSESNEQMGKICGEKTCNTTNNSGRQISKCFGPKSTHVSDYSCILHSFIHHQSKIADDSYLEFCDFKTPVNVLGNSIISNCQLSNPDHVDRATITIPENTFLHTIPILVPNHNRHSSSYTDENNSVKNNGDNDDDDQDNENFKEYYVTVVFNIDENLKKRINISEVGSLPLNDSDLRTFLRQRTLKVEDILPAEKGGIGTLPKEKSSTRKCESSVDGGCGNASVYDDIVAEPESKKMKTPEETISLWDLKLYPSFKCMTSSALDAIEVKRGQYVKTDCNLCGESPVFYSLSDLLKVKDVKRMLGFRRQLYEKIANSKN